MTDLAPLPVEEYYSYDSLIDSMDVERLVEVSDDDYQGDTRLLLVKDGRYGYLTFGWGSCSGCDWLESAYDDYNEVVEIRDSMWNGIVWRDSKEEMLEFFQGRDWELSDYAWRSEEIKKFVQESIEALSK